MSEPPDYVIEAARLAALKSPCAKSKRGVVLFTCEPRHGRYDFASHAGEGFNGPPSGFSCGNSDACRRDCAKLCLHAEQRAILDAIGGPTPWSSLPLSDLDLLHVKVIDGQVVPGGGPSCWQCSRLVVEVGLRGVWLYEGRCAYCAKPNCDRIHPPIAAESLPGEWRFYTAEEFHRETLRACGIEVAP